MIWSQTKLGHTISSIYPEKKLYKSVTTSPRDHTVV